VRRGDLLGRAPNKARIKFRRRWIALYVARAHHFPPKVYSGKAPNYPRFSFITVGRANCSPVGGSVLQLRVARALKPRAVSIIKVCRVNKSRRYARRDASRYIFFSLFLPRTRRQYLASFAGPPPFFSSRAPNESPKSRETFEKQKKKRNEFFCQRRLSITRGWGHVRLSCAFLALMVPLLVPSNVKFVGHYGNFGNGLLSSSSSSFSHACQHKSPDEYRSSRLETKPRSLSLSLSLAVSAG